MEVSSFPRRLFLLLLFIANFSFPFSKVILIFPKCKEKFTNLIHLCQDHEDVEQDVEVAEVRVGYLVLEPVEHVLDALVTAVDGLAEDEDGCEADAETGLNEDLKT